MFSHPLLPLAGKSLRPIEIRDGKLQDGRKQHPEKIWNVRIGDPFDVRVNGVKRPDKRCKNKEDIDSGQKIIFESELKRGESEIKNEVEDEWHGDHPRDLFGECFVKYGAK